MRQYEFKNKDGDIDVIVITDGIGEQKRVFVTETPRGISYPGDVTPTPPNSNNKIFEMGFNFISGVLYEHLDFVMFARKNGLQLIQWNEGLGELSPEVIVSFVEYVFTATSPVQFTAAGEKKVIAITSTKKEDSGTVEDTAYTGEITKGADVFTWSAADHSVTASANASAVVKTGELTLTQTDTGNVVKVVLNQAAQAS